MSKRFSKIYVEITNYCNLHCSFCSIDSREKREMTTKEFEEVIIKIKEYTDSIYLHVKGEPLLHRKLDEILKICDDNKISVKITTNGTLLKDKKDILLNHHIKQINVSLHSENKLPNYFEDVFNVCDELSKSYTVVYRLWTLPTLNLDMLSTIIVDKINNHYHLSDNVLDKIKYDKNIKIASSIYIDKDYEFKWPKVNYKKNNIGTCLGTKSHIAILSNGVITPCCLDSSGIIKLGNIFDDTIEDVLNSELFLRINNGFKNNQLVCELCQSCTYRERFEKK